MTPQKLQSLRISSEEKVRSQSSVWTIFLVVAGILAVVLFFAWPRESDAVRTMGQKPEETSGKSPEAKSPAAKSPAPVGSADGSGAAGASSDAARQTAPVSSGRGESILTVSGYIINRERIELSPRFMGVVKWVGVKKGDPVTNNQVVVLLDDAEYQARLAETKGRVAAARVAVEKAEISYRRVTRLTRDRVESQQIEDDARLAVASAKAVLEEMEGQARGIQNYVDWTVIRSPINGVVLEKLVDPNELVTPQSFGGTRGPSTALIALADPKDLQVEIDLNEADVAKVFLNQKCAISPEAYPDKVYDGFVAEKAPEANRQKGTLQVKVQILNPDQFLTPELSAKVDFFGEGGKR